MYWGNRDVLKGEIVYIFEGGIENLEKLDWEGELFFY